MPTILIYDLDDEGRKSVRETLSIRREWGLLSAETGDEAIDRLKQNPVDMIVVDADTLNRNDDPLLEWLRSHSSSRVPIIVLTASGVKSSPRSRVEALLLGAASYIPRSTIARDLVVTVERILTLVGCRRRHAQLDEVLETTESKFTLEDNNLELVPVLVRHLTDMCEEFAVCLNGNRLQTAVALEEAIINGVVHGNLEVPSSLRDEDGSQRFHDLVRLRRSQSPYCERKLRVRGMFTTGEAQFTISDEGPGFDPQSVPDPTLVENLEKPHGRGLYLVRAFMDRVSFNEQGNVIHLVKCAPADSSVRPKAHVN